MLTIRLTRKGKKNQPFFRVVVVDKRRSSKGGRSVEEVGYFDPLTKRKSFKKERVLYWISKGAKPSPTIHNLLVSEKILDAKKIAKHKAPKKPAEATPTALAAPEVKAGEAVPAADLPAQAEKPMESAPAAEQPKAEEKKDEKPAQKTEEKPAA